MDKKVLEYTREQGLPDPVFVMKWKGYDVYEPDFKPDSVDGIEQPVLVGYPQYILSKNGVIRKSTVDEGFEILDALPDEE